MNNLEEIRAGMWKGLKSVTLLSLSTNKIKSIDGDAWAELPSLKNLYLKENRLTLATDTFKDLDKLEMVNLRGNEITSAPSGCFKKLTGLKHLWLDVNKLLVELEWLGVMINKISSIPQNGFGNLPKLKRLFLTDNRLTTLNSNMFNSSQYPNSNGHPPQLEISLDDNPFHCVNRLCWLKSAESEGWLSWASKGTPSCANIPGWSWNNINLDC